MKKGYKIFKILGLCLVPICMSGCFGGAGTGTGTTNTQNDANIAVTAISLDKTTADMEYGDRITLTATVTPDNATNTTITWTTSKSSVATVEDGVVEAVGEGTATITAKSSNGKTAKCTVTVVDNREKPVAVSSIALDKSEITMEVYTTETLIATILPDNATDKTTTWSSSKTTVATVENGVISAIKTGTATITAKSSNGKTSKCTVTVIDTPIINNEKFTKENVYIYAGTYSIFGIETVYDVRYTFKTDGSAIIEDKVASTTVDRTYKINDGMLYIYDGTELDSMFFYYDNILLKASVLPVILIKDGSAVSQKGTSIIGYYAIIEVNVGDALGVLNGENSNCFAVPLMANGELKNPDRYTQKISSDQIGSGDFNTQSAGTKIIKVNIGGKLYNCLFIVRA